MVQGLGDLHYHLPITFLSNIKHAKKMARTLVSTGTWPSVALKWLVSALGWSVHPAALVERIAGWEESTEGISSLLKFGLKTISAQCP